MFEVTVETRNGLSISPPRLLFESDYVQTGAWRARMYDVTPDGKRFIMLKPEPDATRTDVVVVQNWLEELKQRVPLK